MDKCNIKLKANNDGIFSWVTKGMYGLPQAWWISYDALVKHREPWTHNSRTINFTLVVDDYGVKYSGKEHSLHLRSELEYKYKVPTDWEGKLYIGIALKWDYENFTVQLSMPVYVREELNSLQHKKPKIPKDFPYPWKQLIYGGNN